MKKILFAFFCFLITALGLPVFVFAQNNILSGIVVDGKSNMHLAFVKIVVNNSLTNIDTDLNGMFTIRSHEPIRQLQISHSGYQTLLLDVTGKVSPLVIKLISNRYDVDSLVKVKPDIYNYVDSSLQTEDIEQMKRQLGPLLRGEVGKGWFSFDLRRLFHYNQFEGIYLGVGGHTNDKLSQTFSFGGYSGYGFKDQKVKYGFDASSWLDRDRHFTIKAGYSYDTRESMGSRFFDENIGTIDPSAFRFFYVRKMNYEQKATFSVSYKLKQANFYGAIQSLIVNRGYDINNGIKVQLPDTYNVSGMVAGIRLSPGENDVRVPAETNSTLSVHPVLWLQVTRGIPGLLNGNYNFNRFEGKLQLNHKFSNFGTSTFQVTGGLLKGIAPYFEYFNGRGTYGNFGLFASGSFVTMHPDEFTNDKSIGIFFSHSFRNSIDHSKIFNPDPVLVFNYGWGRLQNYPTYYFLPATDMHKGYIEAGFQLNNLLDLKVYGLGLGAYYRMGAYSFAKSMENLVFKIVVSFPD